MKKKNTFPLVDGTWRGVGDCAKYVFDINANMATRIKEKSS